jgi:predicted HTH domain antitoxin
VTDDPIEAGEFWYHNFLLVHLLGQKKNMNRQTITVDFPSDILLTLNENENELKQNIKLSLAIRLYRLQKITIGKAAQIAGLPRFSFETVLSENGVPISHLTIDDIVNDITKLK